jgi:hypothetical protein
MELFETPKKEFKTCKDCIHRIVAQYGSGTRVQYCNIRGSNRTESGKLKIKAKDRQCLVFEEKTKGHKTTVIKQSL